MDYIHAYIGTQPQYIERKYGHHHHGKYQKPALESSLSHDICGHICKSKAFEI